MGTVEKPCPGCHLRSLSLLGWTPACTGHPSICLTRAHLLFWDATEFQLPAAPHTVRSVSRRVRGHSDCMRCVLRCTEAEWLCRLHALSLPLE